MNIQSEDVLDKLSFKTSIPKRLKQIKVRDADADIIESVLNMQIQREI